MRTHLAGMANVLEAETHICVVRCRRYNHDIKLEVRLMGTNDRLSERIWGLSTGMSASKSKCYQAANWHAFYLNTMTQFFIKSNTTAQSMEIGFLQVLPR
jgi:hypothetical protein